MSEFTLPYRTTRFSLPIIFCLLLLLTVTGLSAPGAGITAGDEIKIGTKVG